MRFSKWHALGNSYLARRAGDASTRTSARRLCDVRYGVGSDGVLEVVARAGTRGGDRDLEPRRLRRRVLRQRQPHRRRVARSAGRRRHSRRSRVGGRTYGAALRDDGTIAMGVGDVEVGEIETVELDGERVELTAVSVGNPHAVVRAEPTPEALLRIGPQLEVHARFPERTNVQLVRVDGQQRAHRARLGARRGGDERVRLERSRGCGRCDRERLVREPGARAHARRRAARRARRREPDHARRPGRADLRGRAGLDGELELAQRRRSGSAARRATPGASR